MYWDGTVIFGLVTVALVIIVTGGLVGFAVYDHYRKKK